MIPSLSGIRGNLEADPLDEQFERLGQSGGDFSAGRRAQRRSPGRPAVLVLLPLGIALGPQGLNVLTSGLTSAIDPILSVTIAGLGVLVGLGVGSDARDDRALVAGASLEAALTSVLVISGLLGAGVLLSTPLGVPILPVALVGIIGLCAAFSAVDPDQSETPSTAVARLRSLDGIVPIAAGAVVLAWFRDASSPAWTAVQAGAIAVIIAAAVWLLIAETATDSEQRVFSAGALLLVAGAAEFLALSALFSGFIAGVVWNRLDGTARDHLARDIRYVRHPMVALLLLAAGARAQLSMEAAILVIVYVVCRAAGKVVGGWLARHTTTRGLPPDVGLHLIAPGVVGIALAVDAQGAIRLPGDWLLAVVVLGAIVSEVLSLAFPPREAA
jgi:hypothetical protein